MKAIVKEYDAFISYRHSELDSFVAEHLHKELEAFRLPKNLAKQKKEGEKTRITRVFRDREELPIATNLSQPIREALENSQFLIVICTPRLRESVWCQKEIETFIELHGRERILAVLAEGEPRESFPDLLQREEVKEVDSDGVEHSYFRAVEPLAADVRGNDKKEVLKKIKQEVLRLAAPMFYCAYDDLRQRHREQKLKKRLQISMGISGAMLIFGSISLTQALQIKHQSKVIETQYQENLKAQSEILTSVAMDKLKQGDRMLSLQYALDALPQNLKNPERPIVTDAIYALTSALQVYNNGTTLQPDYYLEQTSDITYLLSIGEGYLFTIDEQGKLWIWDAENREVVASYQNDYLGNNYEKVLHFQGTEAFYMLGKSCVKAYGVTEEKELWCQNIETPEYLYYNSIEKEVLVVTSDSFLILDNETGEIQKEAQIPEAYAGKYITYVQKSADGKQYYVAVSDYGEQNVILSVNGSDLQSEIFATFPASIDSIKISEDGQSLFCAANYFDDESSAISVKVDGIVSSYSINSKNKNWEYHIDRTVEAVYPVSDEKVLVQVYSGLAEVDSTSGKELARTDTGGGISGIYMTEDGKYQVLLNDGTVLIEIEDFSFFSSTPTYEVVGNWFERFERMENKYLTLEHNAKRILVYDFKVGEGATKCNLTEEEVLEKYSHKEEQLEMLEVASQEKKQFAVVDVEQNAILFQTEDREQTLGTYPCSASFVQQLIYTPKGDTLCVVYTNGSIDLIDTDSFECVNSMEDIELVFECEEIGSDHFVLTSYTEGYVFEKKTRSCIAKVSGYLAYNEKDNVFYLSGRNGIYTVPFYSNKELVDMAKKSLE